MEAKCDRPSLRDKHWRGLLEWRDYIHERRMLRRSCLWAGDIAISQDVR